MTLPPVATGGRDVNPVIAELADVSRWVCWRTVQRDGKATKVPFTPAGSPASSTDPGTWSSFDECWTAAFADSRHDGIGFVLADADDLVGIDLDECIRDGALSPDAGQLVARFSSYAELSPSGTGIHIICRGRTPEQGRRTCRNGKIEAYGAERFFTVTGARLAGAPEQIRDAQPAIDALWAKHFRLRRTKPPRGNGAADDGALPPYPDQTSIEALLCDPTAAAYWRQSFTVTPADDRSPSGWDLAFAGYLARTGRSRDEIAAFLRAYRAQHAPAKGKHDRASYIWPTVDQVFSKTVPIDDDEWSDQGEQTEDRLRLVPPSAMSWKGAQMHLVNDILGTGMMALLYGESGSAKTLIALSLALHIALGRDWCGHRVQRGFVVYVAPEGGHSVHLRFHAFCRYHGIEPDDELPFRTIPVRCDLCRSHADLAAIVANIRKAERELGRCVLVVIDTVSRALAGGNENSPEDMGQFVVNCDRLREEIGASVLAVHHTPRGGEKPRGHSSLEYGSEIRLAARKIAPRLFGLTLEHVKDGEPGEELLFDLRSVVVGENDDGEDVSGGVVAQAGIVAAGARGNPHGKLTDRQLRIWQELKQAAATGQQAFTFEEFDRLCIRAGAVDLDDRNKRSLFTRLRQQLANKGWITIAGGVIRLAQ